MRRPLHLSDLDAARSQVVLDRLEEVRSIADEILTGLRWPEPERLRRAELLVGSARQWLGINEKPATAA